MHIVNILNDFLVATFGPLGPMLALGVAGILLVSLTVPFMLHRPADPLDKLREARATPAPAAVSGRKGKTDARRGRLRQDTGGTAKLDRFASFLEPQNAEELTAARKKLIQAGYRQKNSVRTFHFMQFALGMGFLILGLLYALLSGGELTVTKMMLSIIIPGGAGYYLPTYWIERRRQNRQTEIINGFPDSLDMMLVCVEAGQSLDQSINRVATEIRAGYPALADEFEIVGNEIKAGKDKITVLRDMGERCGVPDINSFVTVLIQSATFGTSIADALRVFSSEMRDKRVMRAEEKANVLPTKLTLGTMMFTVPPLLIILIGPSIYEIVETFGQLGKQ
jgi:tight adherence protein C